MLELFIGSPRGEFLYYMPRGEPAGIRQGDWKLLVRSRSGNEDPGIMLFNLAADPGEQHNLAAENPELVGKMQRRMLELDAAIEAGARPVWKKP